MDAIDPHPSNANVQIVAFKERYMAEEFATKARTELGQPEIAWFTPGTSHDDSDATMQHSDEGSARAPTKRWQEERDLDVADDE